MIPIWHECPNEVLEMKKAHIYMLEECIFCSNLTNTWHENTNNPVCTTCAASKKVSDIKEDHGQVIRAHKRKGIFNRGGSVRVKRISKLKVKQQLNQSVR